ncbi:PaaI family thioesterase [Enhygromyxa salina]|nr:PaaI family thioesterase [Enhygromyxa salina]
MDTEALARFLAASFPQAATAGFTITALDEGRLTLQLSTDDAHLRPGGTVSGPTMMTLADTATYLLVLAHLGPVALAVTTNLNIHFMRKPQPGMLRASATLLKLGKRIAVAQVGLHGADPELLYAHATVTYSLPPPR